MLRTSRARQTTSCHPQSNITDGVNLNLKRLLVTITDAQKYWGAYLREAGFAARRAVKRSTVFTPAYRHFGKELTLALQNELREHVGANIPSTPVTQQSFGIVSALRP